MKFSANLGFLFRELPLLDAVRAAARAGFKAIELHWPYDSDPAELRAVLAETALPLLAINTVVGNREAGDFGLSALPGREAEARRAIDQAVDFAHAAGARNIHVMAGRAEGTIARQTFISNLQYAAAQIGSRDIGLLIEPLNHRDAAGYFLRTIDSGREVIELSGLDHLRLMFDCYHLQIEGGDLLTRARAAMPMIGHIQIAAVPDRGEPDRGEVDFAWLLPELAAAGYDGVFGAEYRPRATTEAGLGWLRAMTKDPS